ncbi:MAG: hypothetical protein ASARMPREDX12_002940 [Alectoria sarmentosa]|nr:MAG: hypothetical protein ASARMPREDX12_002940 [Alectoria sarmentosa]
MLPPLSKYYYGPAQGWNSTESSPKHNGSSWTSSHSDIPPALPPQLSPGPPAATSLQWMNHSPYSVESSQGWHSPGPSPSAPPASQLSNITRTFHGYLPMPAASHSHVNPTWDSGPPDTSMWGVKYNQKTAQGSEPVSKPPLPPRPHQTPDHHTSHESKTPSPRVSATTIEVPVFLKPVAYDPASTPLLPEPRQPPPQDVQTSAQSPPEPGRLPPPPPQKIPLGHEDMPQAPKSVPQRPWNDPQHSYDDEQQKNSQMSQRPRFDPQNSHDAGNRPYQCLDYEQQPMIPIPQFTSFDVESALSPPESPPEPSLAPQQILPQETTVTQSNEPNRYRAGESLHKASISPLGSTDANRLVPTSKAWEPQAAHVPSPEQRYAVLSPPDGQSISTNDLSIITAGVSTPGSHQTSNTSYRENENREDRGRPEQQGDDSFYWHSGRSSSDAGEDHGQSGSPTATPGDDTVGHRSSTTDSMRLQREHQDISTRSTGLSSTISATYGASALGFGGPSDWEYFGDYEAEEIDDEELYSRPRPRDSNRVVRGSPEVPAESPIDSIQPRNESELFGSDLIRHVNPSLHETGPARPIRGRSSQENVMQELRVSGEGDYGTDARPTSAHSLAPHAALGHAVMSLDTHGQQRPDQDDIIRAWSEAPYVGKVHEVAVAIGVLPDKAEGPVSIAGASLALTPRERMLSVDAMLEDAPSLLKSSEPLDSLNPDERELQCSGDVSATAPDAVLTVTDHRLQVQPLSDQQLPATNDIPEIVEVKPRKEEDITSESGKIPKNGLPPVDVVCLSQSNPIEPSINKMSLDVDSSLDTFTESRTHDLSQATRDTTQTYPDEESHSTSQSNHLELDQQVSQNIVQERLELRSRENWKRNSQEAKSQSSQSSQSSQGSGGITWNDGIMMESSETIESFSRGNLLSKQLIASAETTPEEPYPVLPSKTSPENLDVGDSTKPRQDHSQEHVKAPDTHATRENSPSNDNVTGVPLQATPLTLIDDAFLPHHATSSETEMVLDPYSDLDPWGKASLNRFAAMLREESRAQSNQDKLNIFNVFTSRESRLRVVLYGTDDELIIPQKPVQQKLEAIQKPEKGGFVKQAVERANSIGFERSLKALPALPANRESVTGLSGSTLAPLIIQRGSASKGRGVGLKVRPPGDDPKSKKESEMLSGPSGDDSYVTVDSPLDEVQYSPGGRPAVARLLKTNRGTDVESSQDGRSAFEKDSAASPKTAGSARRADSPSSKEPIAVGLANIGAPPKLACTPLKYNEARSEVKNYLANRKSVCRPYATLTQGSLETASTFGRGEDVKSVGAANIITAPTSQYNSSSQVKVDGCIEAASTNKQKAPGAEGPTDLRRFVKADFDPLLLALPNSDAVVHESSRILDLRNVMEAVPDDFSFIHQSVVAWDAKARKQREKNDRQRYARQVESEQRIDSLFDDHEIGYGDIAELELEFKRSEAARRADEDRSEYQTFVSDVFNLVWTRLHYELDQLIPHYEQYSKLMDHTLAGKDMFESSEEKLALGSTMSSFLALHQKLEIRHQKAFEAVLERDRRLKKTEISPWYTLSNITKVKHLEKQFEDAEKKAIIEYCQQRDARANHLMDVLDQNTLRGVGANQDYMEAIMKAVRRIASGRAFASVSGSKEPTAGFEEVEKAKAITALLASSSEQIVQTFHVADMLLNSADYEVSVAKAKVAKADMATLAKLKEERAKEDQKLMRDLEHRLALIREDSRRTNDEIVKLMLFLGVQNGRADSTRVQAGSAKHEARIQKALEEAKRRNNAPTESEG